jgi:hypothetical protein
MPYNNMISRTDAAALISQEVANEILKNVPARSAVMRLARQLPNMAKAQKRIPVISSLPVAYFVSGDSGQKQTTEVNWTGKYIDAEELAVIVPIPEAVLDDADYDIWSEVRPLLEEAFGVAIDAAVLRGINIPSSWSTNLGGAGLFAGATAASQVLDYSTLTGSGSDLFDILLGEDGLFAKVEADGFAVTGSIAAMTMKGRLRGLREKVYNGTGLVAAGAPMFTASMQEAGRYLLDGTPIEFPNNGAFPSDVLQYAGDWSQLVFAMRQDITYKVLDQAVIQDAAGNIVYNLAQQDMVALRAVMRLGFALPNPINRMQPTEASRFPFAVLVP